HLTVASGARFLFGAAPRAADALDAVGAFLHHAALANGDVRIEQRPDGLGAEIGVFLTVRITEEVEAPDLVRAIRLAKPGPDAAIVHLRIQSFAVVHGSRHRAHRLARRMFALHARDRGEAGAFLDQIG